MKLKELKENRASLHEEMKKLHGAEKFDQEKFNQLDSEFQRMTGLINAEERMAEINSEFEKKTVVKNELLTDEKSVNEAYRQLILKGSPDKVDANIRSNIIEIEKRANVQSTTDNLGGYTIPEGFSEMLEKAALFYSNIPNIAETINTPTGNDFPWPTTNDTSNVAYQVSEAGDLTTSAAAVAFGSSTFKAYKWHTGMVKVNYELLQDSYFDMPTLLRMLFAERKGRGENAAMTTGAGVGSTTIGGVVTGSTLGKTAASATAVTRDELLDLIHSIDPEYRASNNFYIMMNDATLAAIRKLDYGTADARPLYQISAMAGQPDMIEGVKVFVNNAMPAMTAGLKPIICGDFNQYKIRRVNGLRFKTLYELYAGTDQIGMDLLWRWDAFVLNAGTNPIKHLIMAAS